MKIYLASSFAYEDKIKTTIRKCMMNLFKEFLEKKGFSVYNPCELKIENAWDYSMYDWGQKVFEADKKEIDSSDCIVFISYGKENNAGSVWEVGYAYAKNIPIILVSIIPDTPESLMCIHSAHACLKGFEGLQNYDFEKFEKVYELNNKES